MTTITVYKHNHLGERVWQYSGELAARGATWICIRARFNRDDLPTSYVTFRRGDLMTEWFYSDRWHNIFRVQDVDSGRLKGWYCNITRPAVITADTIRADDLALDVFVQPDGGFLVLDEDEFEALALPAEERAQALASVAALRQAVRQRTAPFDEIGIESIS